MHPKLESVKRDCIQATGNATQSLGSGRVIGQIFAHIYFSQEPQTLNDLTRELSISKGSASTAVRTLESWGAVRRIWIKGDRKDHYEALEDFGRIVRKALLEHIKGRIEESERLVEEVETSLKAFDLDPAVPKEELYFFKKRVEVVKTFGEKARYIWDNWIMKFFVKK